MILPRGQDLQSEACVPGALPNGTNEPVGHFLQLLPTWPTSSEKKPPDKRKVKRTNSPQILKPFYMQKIQMLVILEN